MKKKQKKLTGSKKETHILEKSRSFLAKGNEYLAKGNDAEAIKNYSIVLNYLQSMGGDISVDKAHISRMFTEVGQAFVKVNRLNDAIKIFDKAIHQDPRNTDAWTNRGKVLALLSVNIYDDAVKSFNSALKISPENKLALGSEMEKIKMIYPGSYKSNQVKVFISYVRENSEDVARLRKILENNRIDVWQDIDGIDPGKIWKNEIRKAIREGEYFLACFSEEYYKRDRTYMNEELTVAIEELRLRPTDKAWFIPVLLSDCKVPDRDIGAGKTLRDLQWVELYKDWDDGIERIVKAIYSKR